MPRPDKRSPASPLPKDRRASETDDGFKTSKKRAHKGKPGKPSDEPGPARVVPERAERVVPAAAKEEPVLAPMNTNSDRVGFIWSVAELLRGDYKQSEYGRVILPFTVLRRLDQVLEPTREAVRKAAEKHADAAPALRERMLLRAAKGQRFYNTSRMDLRSVMADQNNVAANLVEYINGFSPNARDIVEHFRFDAQIERLESSKLLFLLVKKFAAVDLHPDRVSNLDMGYIFEELIRRFSEQSNETAGEHFTPREVIRLMVNLLFVEDDAALSVPGTVRTMYDPACGTGGMLSVGEEYIRELHPATSLHVFGQELNGESYAICKSDMLIKGQDAEQIKYGNSFSEDKHPTLQVDYLISNPPFGVDWTKAEKEIRGEYDSRGHAGRFGPGLPRKNDGSLLFLLHMMSKMKAREDGGSRLAIVFNGSPLFSGGAGSGESEIRRYVLEHDLLEAIIALPDQMFYNTGINTYVWVVTNRKPEKRRGKVQLVNGVKHFRKMRKSLGDKRKELGEEHIRHITELFHGFEDGPEVKIFDNEDFGYRRITVERPLKLDFRASAERIAKLEEQKAWTGLLESKKKDAAAQERDAEDGRKVQDGVRRALARLDAEKVWMDRPTFVAELKEALEAEGVEVSGAVRKAIVSALGERNEAAAVCRVKGEPEPDPDLRDYENVPLKYDPHGFQEMGDRDHDVPLKEDVDEYMRREVHPYAPDAWVDKSKTIIGYEIPFTRQFYEYVAPRALEVIEGEIRGLEEEIRGLLAEVLG